MNREKLEFGKKTIFFFIVVYGLLCEVFSLFILGFDGGFLAGLVLGMGAVCINLIGLEKVIDFIIKREKIILAFPIYLGRLLLYGLLGFLAYRISLIAVIAYALGVVGLPAAAVLAAVTDSIRERRRKKVDKV